jgi:hypothetical protein
MKVVLAPFQTAAGPADVHSWDSTSRRECGVLRFKLCEEEAEEPDAGGM